MLITVNVCPLLLQKFDISIIFSIFVITKEKDMYLVRFSEYIESDIERGWSSWNFGAQGFEGDFDELVEFLEERRGEDIMISGLNDWVEEDAEVEFDWEDGKRVVYFADCEIRELYNNYWVVVDRVNLDYGEISCLFLDADSDEEAINEGKKLQKTAWGDGESFNPSDCELIFSEDGVNIFKYK